MDICRSCQRALQISLRDRWQSASLLSKAATLTHNNRHQARGLGSHESSRQHKDHRGRYSGEPLLPKEILKLLQPTQNRTPTAAPKDEGLDTSSLDAELVDALQAFKSTLGPRNPLLLDLQARIKAEPGVKLRGSIELHRCIKKYVKVLLSVWMSSLKRSTLASDQANKGTATSQSVNTDAVVQSPGAILERLRKWKILYPEQHITVLGFVIKHIVTRASQVKPLPHQHAMDDMTYLWYTFLRENATTSGPPPTSGSTEVLDWSFLTSLSQATSPKTLTDRLRALFPSITSGSTHEIRRATLLTLYMSKKLIPQEQLSSVTYLDRPNLQPLTSFLHELVDGSSPEPIPKHWWERESSGQKLNGIIKATLAEYNLLPPRIDAQGGSASVLSTSSVNDDSTSVHTTLSEPPPSEHIGQFAKGEEVELRAKDFIKRAARAQERQNGQLAEELFRKVIEYETLALPEDRLPHEVYEHLLRMFISLRMTKLVLQVLRVMSKLGHEADKKLWTTLIRGVTSMDSGVSVNALWQVMIASGIKPDAHAWTARVIALIQTRHAGEAMEALESLAEERLTQHQTQDTTTDSNVDSWMPTIAIANAALSGFSNHREYEPYIPKVLAWMKRMKLEPDIRTYNMLMNFSMRKQSQGEAFRILDRMREKGITPDGTTSTVIVTSIFHTDLLDDLSSEESTDYLLQLLDDIEDEQVRAPMDIKGYATAMHWMTRQRNYGACEALLQRMRRKGIEISPQIQTILMDLYLSAEPPMYEAFESLWITMQYGDHGWEVAFDSIFYHRALERLALHHRVLGTAHIEQVVTRMTERRVRPSWPALQALARVYYERGDRGRLVQLIDDIRAFRGIMRDGASKPFGQSDFWRSIIVTGVLADRGITETWQLMASTPSARSGNRQTQVPQ